jgi:hypothetical protein
MTTATHTKPTTPTFDAAFEQVKDLNEQVLAAARKAANLYVDSYERAIDRATKLEPKVAGLAQQEWLKNLIDAQVDITREVAGSYTTAARSILK